MAGKVKSRLRTDVPAIELNRIYNRAEICELLSISQSTLSNYRRTEGFPLRRVGEGQALGSEILEWWKSRPAKGRNHPGKPRKNSPDQA